MSYQYIISIANRCRESQPLILHIFFYIKKEGFDEETMPITCTNTRGLLRVSYIAFEDDFIKREATCYLRPNIKGEMEILYSHHTDFHRDNEGGPWDAKQQFKMPLSKTNVSEISSHVMHEFWDAFGFTVHDLPRDARMPTPEPQLQGGVTFV